MLKFKGQKFVKWSIARTILKTTTRIMLKRLLSDFFWKRTAITLFAIDKTKGRG